MTFKPLTTLLVCFLLAALPATACTTFVVSNPEGTIVFGRNFDFPVGLGHIHINTRNQQKTALIRPPEKPLTWISKYGSVTFNQAGREFPYGGMNEAGLVIEQMWLQEAIYPEIDDRYGLNELQWIQYQLDNASSVDEVIQSDSLVRISKLSTSFLHFLVADKSGAVATIEYIGGKMLVHRGNRLPYPVLSNCPYEHSLAYKSSMDNGNSSDFNAWTQNSSGRFIKAAELIENYNGAENLVDFTCRVLDSVAQPGQTQWQIAYNITERKIYFKTQLNPVRQIIDINQIDFSCSNKNLFIPITEHNIQPESFRSLTEEENYNLMYTVVNRIEFLKNTVPAAYLELSSKYFTTVHCAR